MKTISNFRPTLLGRFHTWHAGPAYAGDRAVLPVCEKKVRFEPRPVSRSARAKKVANAPGLRALLGTAVLLWAALQLGRWQFYRNPATVFFDAARAAEDRYSAVREREARAFMRAAEHEQVDVGRAGEHPRLCATFMTVKRDVEEQFLSNAIGSLLEGLNLAERSELHLKALFAHVEPAVQPDWTQPWLRDLVDDVYTYDSVVSERDMSALVKRATEGNFDPKAPLDYSIALQRCYDTTKAPFIAVLEDDILLAHGWFARTMHGLTQIEQNAKENTQQEPWLFMRLFNQVRGQEPIERCLVSSTQVYVSVALSALVFMGMLLYRRRSKSSRANLDNWVVAVVCLVTIPGLVFFGFQALAASVPPPMASPPRVVQEPFAGNSQGLIFHREQIPDLVKHLREKEEGNYDLIIEDYARNHKMPAYSLHPAQIQHVGSHASSVQPHGKATQLVSAAFDEHDSKLLKEQHAELVAMQYGSAASDTEMEASP